MRRYLAPPAMKGEEEEWHGGDDIDWEGAPARVRARRGLSGAGEHTLGECGESGRFGARLVDAVSCASRSLAGLKREVFIGQNQGKQQEGRSASGPQCRNCIDTENIGREQ